LKNFPGAKEDFWGKKDLWFETGDAKGKPGLYRNHSPEWGAMAKEGETEKMGRGREGGDFHL